MPGGLLLYGRLHNAQAVFLLKNSGIQPAPEPKIIPRASHNVSRADISKNALKVLYRLNSAGFEAFLVGGSVRDALLGLHPVEHEHAVQVVELVLVHARFELVGFALDDVAVDVDTGSYTVMRQWVSEGLIPPPESVRPEEYVNFFDQGYPAPDRDTFAVYADGGPTPWTDQSEDVVLRIGIKGRELAERVRRLALRCQGAAATRGAMGTLGAAALGFARRAFQEAIAHGSVGVADTHDHAPGETAFTDICPVFFVKHGSGKRREQGDAIAAEFEKVAKREIPFGTMIATASAGCSSNNRLFSCRGDTRGHS